jgi:uncharacterized protein GlcG (DUF336 family)
MTENSMRRILFVAVAVVSSPVSAQPASTMNAQTAQAIVTGCATHATAKKQSHAIVVVDQGGNMVAALRMDGNGSGIFDFSRAKAEAAAAWGFSTEQMLEASRGTPGFDRAPKIVIVPGGLPVFSADGKSRIGAIGVSGEAPADDAACGEAGIASAGLRSTRAN